ncbi:zinc finger protein 37-like [Condylostylus longicornis]|uniref:zinc finger protein 37-like n=1 Tax=Condylostylus longicornis TaxID=2530218 RepID=UPI00244DE737|nr:zinc finger protein 37-like [Condylostylus longicornis]
MKIDEICRTCLSESSDLRSIFKLGVIAGKTTTLSRVLMEFTKLTINESDIFPDKMCYGCVIQANQSFAFLQTCLESDRYLKEKLGSPKTSRRISDCNDDFTMGEPETQTVYLYNAVNIEGDNEIDVHIEPSEVKVIKGHSARSLSRNNDHNIIISSDDRSEQDQNESEGIIQHIIEDDSIETEILEIEQEDEDNTNSSFDNLNNDDDYYDQSTNDMISKMQLKNETVNKALSDLNFDQNDENGNVHMIKVEQNVENISEESKKKRRSRNFSEKMNIPGPPYICKICKKHLSTRSSMKYHMQLHSSSTPFLCNECGEGFKTRNAYEGHMTTHDVNNPHKCTVCGKVYRQANSLKTHMLTHTGEKPFLCGICGKGMTQKSGFKKHMLVHSGEMPFQCHICHKRFRYSSNLIAHKKTHCEVKEKLNSCKICNKAFSSPADLKRHMNIHNSKIVAECRYCNKRFGKLEILAAHIKTNHEMEYKKTNIKTEIDDSVSTE